MSVETIHEFALRALVAAGHVSQAKVDQALEIAGGCQRHATQPPAVGVDVSGAMERGRAAFDEARQSGNHERDALDAALTAALRTGGGAA